MDRWACLDLPALPLQLLLTRLFRQPSTAAEQPAVVVAADKPRAAILWVNRAARRRRIQPGMTYAEGLALDAGLRAGTVSDAEIRRAVEQVTHLLHNFSPRVEPCVEEPGVFWLDASGLAHVFADIHTWGEALLATVRRGRNIDENQVKTSSCIGDVGGSGLRGRLVVGFSRFGTYATARRGAAELVVHQTVADERAFIRVVPLARLGVEPGLRVALDRLGVRDVQGLWGLSPGGLLERFGDRAHQLQALTRGELWAPLVAVPEVRPIRRTRELEHPTVEMPGLLFRIKQELDAALRQLAARHEDLTALHLVLHLEASSVDKQPDRGVHWCRIRPAQPTRDPVQLMDLVRLRLARLFDSGETLSGPVCGFGLEVEGVGHGQAQLDLFVTNPRRDPGAAERALARLRAELGEQAVVRAVPRERHLPEESFTWEPISHIRQARPTTIRGERRRCRRLIHPPQPLMDGGFNLLKLNSLSRMRRVVPSREAALTRMSHQPSAAAPKSSASSRVRIPDSPPSTRMSGTPPVACGPNGLLNNSSSLELSNGVNEHREAGAVNIANPRHFRHPHDDVGSTPDIDLLTGPHLLVGGWWDKAHRREYHYARAPSGQLIWVFRDGHTGRWFLHGIVE